MLLKMSKDGWHLKQRQKGFTLVDIAALVVSSGVLFGVALQGKDMLSDARFENFKADLTRMENIVWDHKARNKRWPGDCNNDGVINYQPLNAVSSTVTDDHFVSASSDAKKEACRMYGEVAETVNSSFADIRVAGLTDDVSNRIISKHSQGDFFQIGQATDGQGQSANVIVAYGVPANVARYVDNYWDGSESGTDGRIRRWDVQANGNDWPEGERKVALAYYFDKVLP